MTHLELISLTPQKKRTFAHLSSFSSAQAGEFTCIKNLSFKMKGQNGIKRIHYLPTGPHKNNSDALEAALLKLSNENNLS